MEKPIVIIGAGYGGMCTALELGKKRRDLDRQIILIDRGSHFTFTPLLYEVATGFDQRERKINHRVEESLALGARVSYESLGTHFASHGITFLDGEVTGIDPEAHTVTISGEKNIEWSNLVLAMGGEVETFGIPGLHAHAHQLKTLRQALTLRRALRRAISKKERNEAPHVSIVVGGAGATGVEFVGELVHFFGHIVRSGILSWSDISITMVEANHSLLSQFPAMFSRHARDLFDDWCVKLYLDTCIRSVESGRVVIAPRPLKPGETPASLICDFRDEAQRMIDADLFVWTGGVRGPEILLRSNLVVDPHGRIPVDVHCKTQYPDVYAIGDCATLHDSEKKAPPTLGQVADAQAHVVSRVIIDRIKGKTTSAKYSFPYIHALVPLGGRYALADVGGIQFAGFFAWVVRELANLRYFLHILPARMAFRIFFHGARVYLKND